MNAWAALSTGAGMGLAYYGGLWLTLGRVERPARLSFVASWTARFTIVGLSFYMLTAQSIAFGIAALTGLLLARGYLLRNLGGPIRG